MAFPPSTFSTGQLVTAAILNANVRDNVNELNGGGLVPVGIVTPWGAAISLIPSGWGLCDGGGGRLDLRDVFVISGDGNVYNPGDSGGAASNTPAAHTAHVIGGTGAHTAHTIGNSDHGTVFANPLAGASEGAVPPAGHTGQSIDAHAAHSGAALDSAGTVHGHGAGISLLPPYHARAFMQKAASGLSIGTPRTWTAGEVPSAAMMNAELRDNINYLADLALPVGTIAQWTGLASSIPSGWHLCDGTGGTPDLRSKFIVGAGSTYAVGDTGGNDTATIPAHTAHTPTQPADHANHVVGQPADHGFISVSAGATSGTFVAGGHTHGTLDVNGHSAHTTFAVNAHSSHGSISVLPYFYALCYMQLTSVPTVTTPRTWVNGETVQAPQFNTYIRDNELAIQAAQVPIGTVVIWSGSLASVPAGYDVIVFGPVFPVGAGNSADGHYVPTQTGGTGSVTPAAHNDHSVTQPTAHGSHVVTQPAAHTLSQLFTATNLLFNSTSNNHNFTVTAHDVHAFTVDAHSAHAAITTQPPFKAYAYILRTS